METRSGALEKRTALKQVRGNTLHISQCTLYIKYIILPLSLPPSLPPSLPLSLSLSLSLSFSQITAQGVQEVCGHTQLLSTRLEEQSNIAVATLKVCTHQSCDSHVIYTTTESRGRHHTSVDHTSHLVRGATSGRSHRCQ